MTTTNDKPISQLLGLLNEHRKYVWIAVIIASYALLGSNQAVEKRPDENIQMKVTLSVGSKSNGVKDEA